MFSCELFLRYACSYFKVPHLWCVFGNEEDVTFLILVVITGKCRLEKTMQAFSFIFVKFEKLDDL